MKVKKLVKVGGRYVEQYVDKGPSRALSNHGTSVSARRRAIKRALA